MRFRMYGGKKMAGFGALSPITGANCPAGGSWETWCDCMWPPGDPMNSKCRDKPFPVGMFTPPWTDVGAAVRGIPKPGSIGYQIASSILPGVTTTITNAIPPGLPGSTQGGTQGGPPGGGVAVNVNPNPVAPADPGIFGIPKTVALVGAAAILGGIFYFKK